MPNSCHQTAVALCNPQYISSALFSDACKGIQEGNMHGANYIWIAPLNTLNSIAAMVLAPVIALVNLIATAVFGLLSLCAQNSEECKETARQFATLALFNISLDFAVHAVRIGRPDLNHQEALNLIGINISSADGDDI